MIRKSMVLFSFGLLLMSSYAYACGGSSCSGNSCGGGCSCGGKANHMNHQCTDTSVVQAPTKAVETENKICPVEGAKIGSMGEPVKVVHGGRIYNLCCSACIDKFETDPEKYSKISERT